MADALTSHVHVWLPAERAHEPTLLLLHGTGGDERDLLSLARQLAPAAAVLSARGNVREHGMPRWFRRHAEGVFDEEDLKTRAGELVRFVEAAARRYGFDRDNVVAVGFSNGANIASGALLLYPDAFRGAVLLAAMIPFRPAELPDLTRLAVFIGAGRADPIAPPERAEELARMLDDAGASVEVVWHPGGHTLPQHVIEAAQRWLQKFRTATGSPPTPRP